MELSSLKAINAVEDKVMENENKKRKIIGISQVFKTLKVI